MALEAELRSRVESSLKELEGITNTLREIKRLADSQKNSAEQLARVASLTESTGTQNRQLLDGIGQIGSILQRAVEAVQAADAAIVVEQVGVVGESVREVGRAASTSAQVESVLDKFSSVQSRLESIQDTVASSSKSNVSALEKLGSTFKEALAEVESSIENQTNRVGRALSVSWLAVVMATVAVILCTIIIIK